MDSRVAGPGDGHSGIAGDLLMCGTRSDEVSGHVKEGPLYPDVALFTRVPEARHGNVPHRAHYLISGIACMRALADLMSWYVQAGRERRYW
jgi:hypothetical protein